MTKPPFSWVFWGTPGGGSCHFGKKTHLASEVSPLEPDLACHICGDRWELV